MTNFIVGFFTGALFFMFIMASMVAGKDDDKEHNQKGYEDGINDLYEKLQGSFYYTSYTEDIITREDLDNVVAEMRANNGN